MRLREVSTEADHRLFLRIPQLLHGKEAAFIRPLDKDVAEVFDPQKNKAYKGGAAVRWILEDGKGASIGRIAAFVNRKYKQDQPTGGIGFFDCVDSTEVATLLFNTAKTWLQEKGMGAMDGPINFGERDRWWGLLVEGFHEPLYGMAWHPPYYKRLFEDYGFLPYFHQFCYGMRVDTRLPEKLYTRHAALQAEGGYEARMIDTARLDDYARDFTRIYNEAFAVHGEGKSLDERIARGMFAKMKAAMDEHVSWFVYHNGRPVGVWINLPDLNQYFKHFNGRLGLPEKLRFLWMKKFGKCSRFVGIVFGIVKEYQGKGVDAFMIIEAAKVIQPRHEYNTYEMQWIGDFNPKMVNIAEGLGTERNRTLTTYRYLFDRSKEFKRHPLVGQG